MTPQTSLMRLRRSFSDRLLSVFLVLLTYHGSLLDMDQSSCSSIASCSSSSSNAFPPASEAGGSSSPPSSWLPGWLQSRGRRRLGSGVAAHTDCVLNGEQQRLAEMLNELRPAEAYDPEWLQQQMRDHHNLTGVCPTFRFPGSTSLEQQSLCPWNVVEDYRPDRFPRFLLVARCQCRHCGGPSGFGGPPSLYSCIPLYHNVAVIREYCHNGEIHFRWDRESVSVGCVCAHPVTRQVP